MHFPAFSNQKLSKEKPDLLNNLALAIRFINIHDVSHILLDLSHHHSIIWNIRDRQLNPIDPNLIPQHDFLSIHIPSQFSCPSNCKERLQSWLSIHATLLPIREL